MFNMYQQGTAYDAEDWYWQRSDGTLFSSRRLETVPPTDRDFQAWSSRGNIPTPYPKEDGRESTAALQVELDKYNLHASLDHYAAGVRYAAEISGVDAKIGGETLRIATDRDTVAGMQVVILRLMRGIRKDGEALKVFADGAIRPATNADAEAAIDAALNHVQAAFDLEGMVQADIAAGKITSKADVDSAFTALTA